MTSVLAVVFILAAAMHLTLSPMHIFMPSMVVGGRPNSSIHPAMKHFLAVLGAAHGAFASQFVAAAFLPNNTRALFCCVCLFGYAVLGPLGDAVALEQPPTLWECLNCCFSSSRGFDDADKDGDGYLTEEEWRAAQEAGVIPKHRKFSRVLAAVDSDGDGRVSLREFKKLKPPSINFPIIVAVLMLGLVSDQGLSKYSLTGAAIVLLGLLLFVAVASTKSDACRKGSDEDEGEEGDYDDDDERR